MLPRRRPEPSFADSCRERSRSRAVVSVSVGLTESQGPAQNRVGACLQRFWNAGIITDDRQSERAIGRPCARGLSPATGRLPAADPSR